MSPKKTDDKATPKADAPKTEAPKKKATAKPSGVSQAKFDALQADYDALAEKHAEIKKAAVVACGVAAQRARAGGVPDPAAFAPFKHLHSLAHAE